MTPQEFRSLWVREASEQFGMVLEVLPLEKPVSEKMTGRKKTAA